MKPGFVKIRVYGRNRAYLTEKLRLNGINIYDLSCNTGEFGFFVYKKDLRKTFAILDDMCYNYNADRFSCGEARVLAFIKRLGLVAGLILFSALLAFSQRYVWRLDISGNSNVPDKVIENALAANDISVGGRLYRFNSKELSAAIEGIEGVKTATVTLKGTTVKVEITETDAPAPPLYVSSADICSLYDATVTRVIVREGTALVACGQNVFAGEPLIGAFRYTGDNANKAPCGAGGVVYGTVYLTKNVTVASERFKYVPVNVSRRTRLSFFGINIGKKPVGGDCVTVEETTRKLNVFLPISVGRIKVTRYEKRKITEDISVLAQKTCEAVTSEFIDGRITSGLSSDYYVRELGGGLYCVSVVIRAETIIGGL